MKLYAYGEDALTLWTLTSMLIDVFNLLGDPTHPEDCVAYYRPSFGRRGGSSRSEFGEFDFILFTNQVVYLGESKWGNCSERAIGTNRIVLRPEQKL